MHSLARQARTSISSLYHFFPDRGSVLDALGDIHRAGVQRSTRKLGFIADSEWHTIPVAAVADRLSAPYAADLRQHPDYFSLAKGRSVEEDSAEFMHVMVRVLKARWPSMADGERADYGLMTNLITAGVMHAGFQLAPERVELLLREIPRVLTAYLEILERGLVPASATG